MTVRVRQDTPDEVPRPPISGRCKVCRVLLIDVRANEVVVAPSGKAHFGKEGGDTTCGKDATRDGWWWPL